MRAPYFLLLVIKPYKTPEMYRNLHLVRRVVPLLSRAQHPLGNSRQEWLRCGRRSLPEGRKPGMSNCGGVLLLGCVLCTLNP